MKKTFQVGESCFVYHSGSRLKMVVTIVMSDCYVLESPTQGTIYAHIKQLRKLKPKPKREPRRVWVNSFILENKDFDVVSAYKSKSNYDDDYDADAIEFIEVIK